MPTDVPHLEPRLCNLRSHLRHILTSNTTRASIFWSDPPRFVAQISPTSFSDNYFVWRFAQIFRLGIYPGLCRRESLVLRAWKSQQSFFHRPFKTLYQALRVQ